MTNDFADVSVRFFSVEAEGPSLLRLAGDLDMLAAPTPELALTPLTSGGGSITVDLGALTFLDSTGLRVLCQAKRELGDGGRIVLLNAAPSVRRILEITGLIGVFDLDDDPASLTTHELTGPVSAG